MGFFQGRKILLVDDESLLLEALGAMLEDLGLQVHRALYLKEAMKLIRSNEFDLILTDLNLEKTNAGVELAAECKKMGGSAPAVILMTGDDTKIRNQYQALGFMAVLPKPFPEAQLEAAM